jgi:putative membrane protein
MRSSVPVISLMRFNIIGTDCPCFSEKVGTMFTLFAAEGAVGFLPDHFWASLAASGIFGLLGIALLLLGYWLFDLITPRLDVQKELYEKNLAVAVVIAALLLGIAYVAAHVVQ